MELGFGVRAGIRVKVGVAVRVGVGVRIRVRVRVRVRVKPQLLVGGPVLAEQADARRVDDLVVVAALVPAELHPGAEAVHAKRGRPSLGRFRAHRAVDAHLRAQVAPAVQAVVLASLPRHEGLPLLLVGAARGLVHLSSKGCSLSASGSACVPLHGRGETPADELARDR